jgi:hypothetical protein
VPVKSAEQQAAAMLLSVRELLVRQRTQLVNAMRGHAAEIGVVAPLGEKGLAELRTEIAAADDTSIPPAAKQAIALLIARQRPGKSALPGGRSLPRRGACEKMPNVVIPGRGHCPRARNPWTPDVEHIGNWGVLRFRARPFGPPRNDVSWKQQFLHTLEGWGPQAMHVVRQSDPGSDPKGRPEARPPDRLAQHIDMRHQQVGAAIEQVQSKKEGPAWNSIAAILRHETSMPCVWERRNALRCSALRLLNVYYLAMSGTCTTSFDPFLEPNQLVLTTFVASKRFHMM